MADLKGLHPYVRQQAEKLIANGSNRIKNGNYKVIITQGYRSKAEQDKLYAQGRTAPGKIVTNAPGGTSMHNFGLAVDFALGTKDGKKASWNTVADWDKDGKADWMEVVSEALKLGFFWGGNFKSFTDKPHFQMLGGLTEKEVRAGKTPTFPSLDTDIEPVAKLVSKTKATVPKKKPAVKKYESIVDYLKSKDLPYDFVSRHNLAKKHGIKGYNGTAEQNIKLLDILQK